MGQTMFKKLACCGWNGELEGEGEGNPRGGGGGGKFEKLIWATSVRLPILAKTLHVCCQEHTHTLTHTHTHKLWHTHTVTQTVSVQRLVTWIGTMSCWRERAWCVLCAGRGRNSLVFFGAASRKNPPPPAAAPQRQPTRTHARTNAHTTGGLRAQESAEGVGSWFSFFFFSISL